MPRRLAHFSDPRLDAQVEELIKHSNATRDAADKHAARRDNPHKVTAEQVGAPSIEDMQAVVDAHATATTGVHGVGASEVESKAGAQAKADAAEAAAKAYTDAHAGRTDNPHNVTAAQVGAVPVTGGTMTGKLTAPSYGSQDTRSVATTPGNYTAEMRLQFKFLSAIGLSGIASGTYCQLLGYRAWTDDSGGRAHELAFTDGGIYYRNGTQAAGWGSWQKVWHAGNDGAGSGLDADMLDGYHASYFQPASDERLKTDIQPLADALSKVLSLRGVSFVWNNKAREVSANRQTMAGREIGLLAGEVAQVVPEVVLDWVETPDGVTYKTVDSARLVALLVEAIKELNAKVEVLQARVAALEGSTP